MTGAALLSAAAFRLRKVLPQRRFNGRASMHSPCAWFRCRSY